MGLTRALMTQHCARFVLRHREVSLAEWVGACSVGGCQLICVTLCRRPRLHLQTRGKRCPPHRKIKWQRLPRKLRRYAVTFDCLLRASHRVHCL